MLVARPFYRRACRQTWLSPSHQWLYGMLFLTFCDVKKSTNFTIHSVAIYYSDKDLDGFNELNKVCSFGGTMDIDHQH